MRARADSSGSRERVSPDASVMQVLRVDLASHLEPRGQRQGDGSDGGPPPHGLVPAAQVSPHGPLAHCQGAKGQNSLTERGRGHEAAMQASAQGRGGQAQVLLQGRGGRGPAPAAGTEGRGPGSCCRDGVDGARLPLQGWRGWAQLPLQGWGGQGQAPAAGTRGTGPGSHHRNGVNRAGSRCRDGVDGPSSRCRTGCLRTSYCFSLARFHPYRADHAAPC